MSTKSSSWGGIVILAATLVVNVVSGYDQSHLKPPPLQHGQWLPRIDSETSNYYQDHRRDHHEPQQHPRPSQQTSVKYISTYPQQRERPNQNPFNNNYRQVYSSQQYHQEHQNRQHPNFQNVYAEKKIITAIPEPKPRHDEIKEKLGLNLLSSLLPTSVLNLPHSLQQQFQQQGGSNLIEPNSNSPYLDDSELHQDPPQQSNSHPALFPISSFPDNENESGNRQPSLFSGQQFQDNNFAGTSQEEDSADTGYGYSNGGETNVEGGSNIFSKIRNIIPFGSGLLSGLRSNGSGESMEASGGYEASNFPDAESVSLQNGQSEIGGPNTPNFNFLGGNSLPGPFSFNPNQPSFSNGHGQESDGSSEDDGNSGSLNFLPSLPSLPNPFQKLRDAISNISRPSSSAEEGGYDSGPAHQGQSLSHFDFNNFPSLTNGHSQDEAESDWNNEEDGSESGSRFNFPSLPSLPSLPNPLQGLRDVFSNLSRPSAEGGYDNGPVQNSFPFNSNLPSITNGNNPEELEHDAGNDDDDENGNGSAFNFPSLPSLPSLPNPLQGLRDAFNNINPQSSSEGGYDNGPVDITHQFPLDPEEETGDSTATPFQSIADGGLSGVLGPLFKVLSKVAEKYKKATTALPYLKVFVVLFGPVFAAALAAMIIGIVYISIYVPAWAIRLEDLEGEFYIMSIKQILDIVGVDPFDFRRRSLDGRAISEKNVTFGLNGFRKKAFLAGTPHETEYCMERIACELIGRKLLQKESWKEGYIARGIKTLADFGNRGKVRLKTNSMWPSVKVAKTLFDAVATGLIPESDSTKFNSSNFTKTPCMKYACDPGKIARIFLAKDKHIIQTNLKVEDGSEVASNFNISTTTTVSTTQNNTIEEVTL